MRWPRRTVCVCMQRAEMVAPLQTVAGMEVLTSSMFAYLGRELVDVREPSLPTIRGYLYRRACTDHCVMALTALLTLLFEAGKLATQDLSGNDALLRVGERRDILFPLPQHVHSFVRGI